MLKKIIAMTLSLVILMANFSYVNGADGVTTTSATTMTIEDQAKVLQAISILRGDGTSFKLEGELKRSEGAAFIVRLLGKENLVISNKAEYVNLTFTDVNATDWFAPYVGYCVKEGIINGYADNTFKPNDLLSEQAFVKMVLGAMGYKYNLDFEWKTTFNFAYAKGILTALKYKEAVIPVTSYYRGSVVSLIHHVLGMKNATKTGNMVDVLIDAQMLTKEQAKTYKFIVDSLPMKVEELSQSGATTFLIRFNEAPKTLTSANVLIKEKNGTGVIAIKKITPSEIERMLYIEIETPRIDIPYVLTLTGVQDKEGNPLADQTLEFIGNRPDDYTSNYFRIGKVTSLSSNQLDVTFTQPVDMNYVRTMDMLLMKDDQPLIGGSDSNMVITKDTINPYLIHIDLLSYKLEAGSSYALHMAGTLRSTYGTLLKEGTIDSARFIPNVKDTGVLAIESILLEGDKTLSVKFNKNVNTSVATQVYSYYLTTALGLPVKIIKAEMGTSPQVVRLTAEGAIESGKAYKLTVNQAYTTDRSESILDKVTDVLVKTAEKVDLKVLKVTAIGSTRIELVLDQYLDETDVKKIGLYTINGVTNDKYYAVPISVTYDSKASKPTLVLTLAQGNGLIDGHNYKVTMSSDMKYLNGTSLNKDVVVNVLAQAASYEPEGIAKADYIGTNLLSVIRISGSKELAQDVPNVLDSNYTLTYMVGETKKTLKPIGITYVNENVILLRFETLDTSKSYTLNASKLVFTNGTTLDTSKIQTPVTIEVLK